MNGFADMLPRLAECRHIESIYSPYDNKKKTKHAKAAQK